MRRFLCLLLCLAYFAVFCGCRQNEEAIVPSITSTTSDFATQEDTYNLTEASETVETTESTIATDPTINEVPLEDVRLFDWYYEPDELPIPLPNYPVTSSKDQYLIFEGIPDNIVDEYFLELEKCGFTPYPGDYMYNHFYREGCAVFVETYRDVLTVKYYASNVENADRGISPEEAQKLIGINETHLPIDISPKGFFECTGAQLFLQPALVSERHPDRQYTSDHYWTYFYYITPEICLNGSNFHSFAVTDVDQNNVDEVWILRQGYNNGFYDFLLSAYENGELKCEFHELSFVNNLRLDVHNGKLGVLYYDYLRGQETEYAFDPIYLQDGIIQFEASNKGYERDLVCDWSSMSVSTSGGSAFYVIIKKSFGREINVLYYNDGECFGDGGLDLRHEPDPREFIGLDKESLVDKYGDIHGNVGDEREIPVYLSDDGYAYWLHFTDVKVVRVSEFDLLTGELIKEYS